MCHKFGCVFYAPRTMSCDYMLITGKRRGCPATDDCEKYRLTLGDEKPIHRGFRPRNVKQETIDRLDEAYRKYAGLCDTVTDFANRARVPVHTAFHYIRKVHPDSHLMKQDIWYSV